MKVEKGTVVTLAYDITRADGEIIETSDISGPITFVQGSSGLIPGLDKRLIGLAVDDEKTFEFPPEEAFGNEDDSPTRALPRKEFPAEAQLEAGLKFEAGTGTGQTIVLKVVELPDDDTVVVRMVHPLAGQTIGMSVKVLGLREPTAAEAESGKVVIAPPPPPKR